MGCDFVTEARKTLKIPAVFLRFFALRFLVSPHVSFASLRNRFVDRLLAIFLAYWGVTFSVSNGAHANQFDLSQAFSLSSSSNMTSSDSSLQALGDVSRYSNLPGAWVHGSFMNLFGSRDYYFYYPSNHGPGPIPLVVILHGCRQDAQIMAEGSGLNELAEQNGFAVLYPNQDAIYNADRCWNWFFQVNQMRDSGELSLVMGMVWEVGNQLPIDRSKVFVGGFSAGGAMASNLVACYSDIFSGAAIFSGLEFQAAMTIPDSLVAMSQGPSKDTHQSGLDAALCTPGGGKVQAILVLHGSEDSAVNPINSDRIVAQMTKMNDMLDDGRDNDSQNLQILGSHDDQVPGGYAYHSDLYGGLGQVHIMNVTVEGMNHAWSGAKISGQFLDPKGPDAGLLMWQFLSQMAGS